MRKKQVKIVAGETYGIIKVVSDVKDVSRRGCKKWLCKCGRCDKTFIYKGEQILKYKDAGCVECREEERLKKRIEWANTFVGKTYSYIKIVSYNGIDKNNQIIMLTECLNCGSMTTIPLARITNGQAKRCANCNINNLKRGHEISKIASVDGTNVLTIDGRRSVNKNSSTGETGVSYSHKTGKYRAYINFKRKPYHLGLYEKKEDAVNARKEAEKNIYGNFINRYRNEYPERWEKLQKNINK